jgi:HSP20 family protein
VDVELIGNELAISGESRQREHEGTLRTQMRRIGRFEYRVTLPDHVESDKVEAKLDDGLLTVRIPKSERAQRRKIEVES